MSGHPTKFNRVERPEDCEEFLHWLTPTMRGDYEAIFLEGKTRAERAEERGVEPPTVHQNVKRAARRLREIATDQRGEDSA